MRLKKLAFVLAGFLLTVGRAHEYGRPQEKTGEPTLVADAYYWAGPEGNLGIEIVGKFQSEMQLRKTFDLSSEIGLFKSKKYPFQTTTWTLRDILISVDFNGNGSVAIWRVSGPKPLLTNYLESLRRRFEDKSVFYDFGYKLVAFRPSAD